MAFLSPSSEILTATTASFHVLLNHPVVRLCIIYAVEEAQLSKLTPWSRLLLDKLMVAQLLMTLALFYGTRSFITVFTKACHWTLS
jgi:hypothetical protein